MKYLKGDSCSYKEYTQTERTKACTGVLAVQYIRNKAEMQGNTPRTLWEYTAR